MKSRRAFTLVELLVVIGIIVILIAILLPTIAGARKSSQRTACLSNMRQIGNSLTLFTHENRGYLPKAWFNDAVESGVAKSTQWGFRDPMLGWDYVLQRYIRNKAVFRCPTDIDGPIRGDWNNTYAGLPDKPDADDIPASYRLNLSNYLNPLIAIKVFQLRKASESIEILEGTAGPPPGNTYWHHVATWEDTTVAALPGHVSLTYKVNVAWSRHPVGSNYVFADGHAETMAWAETWKPLGSSSVAGTTATRWRQRFDGWVKPAEINWYH